MRPIDGDALDTALVRLAEMLLPGWKEQSRGVRSARALVLDAPTIDPPVVHAKWVVNTDDFTPKKRCTNCGYNKPMKAGEGIEQEPEAFCPSCGATMDENGGNSQ